MSMLVSYPGGTPRERELEHLVKQKSAELEERGRLLYKTKAAIEGLQQELAKAHDNEIRFKEEARVAFEEQGACVTRNCCDPTLCLYSTFIRISRASTGNRDTDSMFSSGSMVSVGVLSELPLLKRIRTYGDGGSETPLTLYACWYNAVNRIAELEDQVTVLEEELDHAKNEAQTETEERLKAQVCHTSCSVCKESSKRTDSNLVQ